MKTKRLFDSDLPAQFGLVSWLEQTRVVLPLKGVEGRFEVTGALASVELDQIYHQSSKQPLDCTYTFPLPAGAAVYRCEIQVNGRVIRAKVEERETARRIYQEQKAAGRRAALVETERENLFTLSLGNIQPEDLIVVRFAWFQTLDRAGEELRLRVPVCPGVRYIPGKPLLRSQSGRGVEDDTDQVPDAARISPPRIDALHPDAAYFSMSGRIAASDAKADSISSPTHAVMVREDGDNIAVQFATNGHVPDRDLVIAWYEPKALGLVSRAWRWQDDGERYALLQLRAPADAGVDTDSRQDFYFLVDQSGSMQGAKWSMTCAALHAFVDLLAAGDRVWITLFESNFRDFAEEPLPAAAVRADRGFRNMESIGTLGGTELLPAAKHVLEKIERHSTGRRANVVLITDGQVGNEAAILREFRRAREVVVHTFGIDTAVNDAFLKSLARQQYGGCWLQTPNDDITGTIAALADRLRRPVLTDVAIGGSWEIGGEKCPDLHACEVALVALRGAASADAINVTSRLPGGAEHRFDLETSATGSEAIRLLWARERIATLLADEKRAEAITVAKKHNLICEGTAFIAWDEAEQVAVAHDEIVQPAMMMNKVLRCMPAPAARTACLLEQSGSWGEAPALRSRAGGRTVMESLNGMKSAFGRLGFGSETMRSMINSIKGGITERKHRAAQMEAAAELLERARRTFHTPLVSTALKAAIKRAMKNIPAGIVEWSKEPGLIVEIEALWKKLCKAGLPESLADRLFAGIFGERGISEERLSAIRNFAASLDGRPFSSASAAANWKTFLEGTIGSDPEGAAAIRQWLDSPQQAAIQK